MPVNSQPLMPLLNAETPRSIPNSSEPSEANFATAYFEKKAPVRSGFFSQFIQRLWTKLNNLLTGKIDRFIPAACADNLESIRRARLILRFGYLGAVFGSFYATFYLLIGHEWGALIVVICSAGFGLVPSLMKRTNSLDVAGNALSLLLTVGFFALCCVEGGAKGHAIAWLASVPLCALLLLGRRRAGQWTIVSFAACAIIVMLDIAGVNLRPTYDAKWESLVSAAGYLGFILFMFMLGMIFETGRKRAFGKMQEALAKLETSNAELVRLNNEKNEFLGIAAHDLKNPLGVVIGTAELLRICKDEKQTDKLIGNIIGAGGRMLHLVKNLLDANAIEEGRFTSNLERCDLHSLVRECLDNNQANAARKEITLQLETSAPCLARADRNATQQILDNLVSNALKYSPRNTTVHLRAVIESGAALVTVCDEGPGISEEDLKKMFGKFTRLSARPTGGESSNGLGLSIVKRLTEAMNGTIRCQSQLGEGAMFILQLPSWK